MRSNDNKINYIFSKGFIDEISLEFFYLYLLLTMQGGPLQIFMTDGLVWYLQAFPAGLVVPYQTH